MPAGHVRPHVEPLGLSTVSAPEPLGLPVGTRWNTAQVATPGVRLKDVTAEPLGLDDVDIATADDAGRCPAPFAGMHQPREVLERKSLDGAPSQKLAWRGVARTCHGMLTGGPVQVASGSTAGHVVGCGGSHTGLRAGMLSLLS
jgi:hypothetical protein